MGIINKIKASPPALPRREGAFSHRWGEKAWLKFRLIISNVRTCLVFALLCSDDSVRGCPSHPSLGGAGGRLPLPRFCVLTLSSGVAVRAMSASSLPSGEGGGEASLFCCKFTTFIFGPSTFLFLLVLSGFFSAQVSEDVYNKIFVLVWQNRSTDAPQRIYRRAVKG